MTARNITFALCTLFLAAVASELFMRLMISREVMFDLWYTPGIHIPDKEFGFVFKPNYHGFMRHVDNVPNVPLDLDENGFRMKRRAEPVRPSRYVVIMGGMSMMMNYGVPDDKTIVTRIGQSSVNNLEVQNTAWAGFDIFRNWHIYLRSLGSKRRPDVAIVCAYRETRDGYGWLPEDFRQLPDSSPPEELFRYMDGLVVPPGGQLHRSLGRLYYRSFVGFKVFQVLDEVLDEWGRLRAGMSPGSSLKGRPAPKQAGLSKRRYQAFLNHLHRYFEQRGSRMLVVFLPINHSPKHYYDGLKAIVPDGIDSVDLQERLFGQMRPEGFIAASHYGEEQSALIGRHLAGEIDRLIEPVNPIGE